MPERALTGTRIRDRRSDLGLRQADLAAAVGISASYLNLIEHNRRPIAGKLLNDIARALGVEAAVLSEGAEHAQLAVLRAAGEAAGLAPADLARAVDLSGRFPTWAGVIEAQARLIRRLELRLAEQSDRLSHDPGLARALHEMISAVTAIHSTAGILVESGDLDPDWQARFHRNIHGDSARLAEGSRQLIRQLEAPEEAGGAAPEAQEEAERHLAARGFHLPAIEAGESPAAVAAAAGLSARARWVLERWLTLYAADAAALPLAPFAQAARGCGWDPAALVAQTGAAPGAVLRRLAALPAEAGQPPMALALADGGGAILMQKAGGGLSLPRGGAACPLWPLFGALAQPGRPLRRAVAIPGPAGEELWLTHAIAETDPTAGFDAVQPLRATMLAIRTDAGDGGGPPLPAGRSCRICPRAACAARREPSILAQGGIGRTRL